MPKTVKIAGSTFPVEAKPGELVHFYDPTTRQERTGTVLDRAPQGPAQGTNPRGYASEGSGLWLWVIPSDRLPHDGASAVRVRYYTTANRRHHVDTGPMVVRTMNGLRWAA